MSDAKFLTLWLRLGEVTMPPVAGGERVTEDLLDKGIHALGKLLNHIGVDLNVGQGAPINRLVLSKGKRPRR